MAGTISTYVTFNGYTSEALTHWQEIFGGDLNLLTYGQTQMEGMPFEPPADALAHGVLTFPGGALISGGDSIGEELPIKDTAYSMLYNAESVEDGREKIDKIVAAGGAETMKFETAPWGGSYGQVFDKYGVMWSISAE
ncbi:VOC family protein [Corynebacterium crudilactis]|uniref:Glyoxalase n=1 Tax=Corynebacterium crudilactis TaxID=1652495 RepID=A0A172QSK3_9CORY|nr:glyoxalase/bleomycin resistance/extradiol dioxygenase family protein [Corynebacterium crudilactis]ANE03666.1 glyoxalase [Corynebacterium crudilactis]